MSGLTEDAIEQNLIDLLENQGYRTIHGSDLDRPLDSVVLEDQLKIALKRLNPDLPESARHEALSKRSNIVVIADEAHRSQYGFTGRVDKDGKIKYGNAKHLQDALTERLFHWFYRHTHRTGRPRLPRPAHKLFLSILVRMLPCEFMTAPFK